MDKIYFCIDLKSFFASAECVERNLDPFKSNLVVADASRGKGAICLAITPAMKNLGIKNRCRIYEIPRNVKYITAPPRMKLYMEYSAKVYSVYLKYISKDDIHVYSIDEAFLDVSNYLSMYNMSYTDLCKKITDDIFLTTGITASAGIGTNLYLAKIALDIMAKKSKNNVGFLDEEIYKKELWYHQPLNDFWQIGKGIQKRLNDIGINNMYDISNCEEYILYRIFGINAELLIDHSIGIEPCTIKEIKAYKPKSNSLSFSQILFEDYTYDKALLIVKEMVDIASLELVKRDLVTDKINLYIGYSKDVIKPSNGSFRMIETTNVYSIMLAYYLELFNKITNKDVFIRKIGISFSDVRKMHIEQLDLFSNREELNEEKKIEQIMNNIKNKHGKNSILRGISLEEGATTMIRNKLIGGHKSGE